MNLPRRASSTASALGTFVVGLLIGAVALYAFAPSAGLGTSVTTTTFRTTITTTPQAPNFVTLVGNFSTGLGTSATAINFVSSGGISYSGQIANGRYSINNLPNQDTYTVKISFTPSPLGNSPCMAGIFAVYLQFQATVTHNWSC